MSRHTGHVVIALYPSSQEAHADLLIAPMGIYVTMRDSDAGNACLIASSGDPESAVVLGEWTARLTSTEVWIA
ncbi:MAG: hypothetical protein WCD35_16625 [Mycobacteriales bacterium]